MNAFYNGNAVLSLVLMEACVITQRDSCAVDIKLETSGKGETA